MSGGGRRLSIAVLAVLATGPVRAETTCRAAIEARVKQCADECIARAKAAVDPEIRDRILGYGCTRNCAKLEMFNEHACPSG